MRNEILSALCAVALLGNPAGAQAPSSAASDHDATTGDEAGDFGNEEAGASVASEADGVEVGEAPPRDGKVDPGNPQVPGQVHTVATGDTLWDLSQKYLGSPWYWPKVWSYNPEIANPHSLNPGNRVRFFSGGGEEGPARVDVIDVDEPIGGADSPDAISMGEESDEVQVIGKIGYTPRTTHKVIHEAFVSSRELEETGVIHSSFAESNMLSYPDTVYLKFKKKGQIRVGEKYVVFHTVGEVKHPRTRSQFGYLTKFLGTLKVQKISPNGIVTAQIIDSWDEIRRGDMVGPFGEKMIESIAVAPNEKDLTGIVVTALVPGLAIMAEHHYIVIDKGNKDGVKPGNTFQVLRQGDPNAIDFWDPTIQRDDSELPEEQIAACITVDVKDNASTCLLTRSLREVLPGDRVVMRLPEADASQKVSSAR